MVKLFGIMEKEMKARLESTKARYEELDKKLIDNDVLSDMNVFKALALYFSIVSNSFIESHNSSNLFEPGKLFVKKSLFNPKHITGISNIFVIYHSSSI